MWGRRFMLAVAVMALATSGCRISGAAPDETPTIPVNTLAPSYPSKAESPGQPAELLWRSSPFVGIPWPKDVAIADDGRIYVLDASSDRIVMLSADGYLTKTWGQLGKSDGEFDFHDWKSEHIRSTGGLTISRGRVFVGDTNRVQIFDLEGKFLGAWGSRGREPGQFTKTSHMATGPDGDIYVLDTALTRVQLFTPDGQLVKHWRVPVKDAEYLSEMCVNASGQLFIAEHFVGDMRLGEPGVRIHKFSPAGQRIKTWGNPTTTTANRMEVSSLVAPPA
jgi:DNA-binding beta-propeller fold protein YncE